MASDLDRKLAEAIAKSYSKRDSGGKFKGIFRDDVELKFWKCSADEHHIDILPYLTAKQDPDYWLDVYTHSKVGVNENTYVCMADSFSKPCPICKYINDIKKDPNVSEEQAQAVWAAQHAVRRSIYNIICNDNNKEQDKGIQIFDVAWWNMEKHLGALCKRKDGGFNTPFALKNGSELFFTRSGSGPKNTNFYGHRFEPRDYNYPDEILTQTYPLDQLIVLPEYEELKEIFYSALDLDPTPAKVVDMKPAETNRVFREAQSMNENAGVRQPEEKHTHTSRALKECPAGGKFGIDIGNYPECKTCDIFDTCSDEKEFSSGNKSPQEEKTEHKAATEQPAEQKQPAQGIRRIPK